ncbi:MAG: Arabinose efflux permease [Rhodospirillales bacterium]|nr:Arabinose efflux permease [Rhodospirillales bacterium]
MTLFGSPERRLVILCGLVAFLSGIVFSMVGALAPMFSRDLAIPAQSIGSIMGSYMLASAISGFVGTLYLDRFDRRKALAVALVGVVIGLLMTGLAPNLPLLIAARVLSGIFAGPSNALSIAIIVDNVPGKRRGSALGTVAAFGALAQIIGLPAGLIVAQTFGSWRDPFFASALVGAALTVLVIANLPAQRAHLEGASSFAIVERLRGMGRLFARFDCVVAFGLQMTGIVPLVAITTIMSIFLVNNLGYPQGALIMLYVIGGGANVIIARYIGRAIDNFGPGTVSLGSAAALSLAVATGYLGLGYGLILAVEAAIHNALQGRLAPLWAKLQAFGFYPELLPVVAVFALFFITSSGRLVVGQTITMRIPRPEERAGFQSLSSAIQSLTMALSALAIPKLLGSTAEGKLTGLEFFCYGVLVVTWIFPPLVYLLDMLLNRRDRAALPAAIAVPAE